MPVLVRSSILPFRSLLGQVLGYMEACGVHSIGEPWLGEAFVNSRHSIPPLMSILPSSAFGMEYKLASGARVCL